MKTIEKSKFTVDENGLLIGKERFLDGMHNKYMQGVRTPYKRTVIEIISGLSNKDFNDTTTYMFNQGQYKFI